MQYFIENISKKKNLHTYKAQNNRKYIRASNVNFSLINNICDDENNLIIKENT